MTAPPRILAIAGSDSSGGAGIQADIKTITMLGGYAMTAITAVTAQNSLGVQAVEVLPAELVLQQVESCLSDIGADAIKIGMLGSPDIAGAVAERLERLELPVVFDPVIVATSGAVLADARTVAAFERLMNLATLTTPNIPELAALAGRRELAGEDEETLAAEALLRSTGARHVLVKGGHRPPGGRLWPSPAGTSSLASGAELSAAAEMRDCLFAMDPELGFTRLDFAHERVDTKHNHGTGCTLSSAIATFLAKGVPLEQAIAQGRRFVRSALEAAPGFGSGHGPMGHQGVR
jgi:hydroxymethylpyrimidine/phosphomethylpyrimidine kinase